MGWFELRARKRERERVLEETEIGEGAKKEGLKSEIGLMGLELHNRVQEAKARGREPENRAREAGRRWREGDGF